MTTTSHPVHDYCKFYRIVDMNKAYAVHSTWLSLKCLGSVTVPVSVPS